LMAGNDSPEQERTAAPKTPKTLAVFDQ